MVMDKADPRFEMCRAKLAPQRPSRQLDISALADKTVHKNEILHLHSDGFYGLLAHRSAVIEQRYYGANATGD